MGKDIMPPAMPDGGVARPGYGGGMGGAEIGGIVGIVLIILGIAIAVALVVFLFISWWKMYTKAGRPGWSNLIPIYGWVEFFNVAWGNGVYFLFMLVPGVNVLVAILSVQKLSEAFGHGIGYTLGLFFFPWIFIPILGLGKSKHLRYEAKKALEAEKEAAYAAALAAKAAEEAAAAAAAAPQEEIPQQPEEAPVAE